MALIPPFFLDCVIAIGFPGSGGKPQYAATGFLYGHFLRKDAEGRKWFKVFIVTNRHVLDGKHEAILRFNPEGNEPSREFPLSLFDSAGKQTWLAHPDVSIDVAAVGINAQHLMDAGIRFSIFDNSEHIATRKIGLETGVSEGDAVFLLGFPMGLVGQNRNYVVVRQGAIARVRDCLEGASKDFWIDCAVFPGNSGGPVVTRPEVVAIDGTKASNTARLIGIVASYLPYQDVAISQQTGRPRIIFEENSGLASVFPVDYVEEVIKQALVQVSEEAAPTVETPAPEAEAPTPPNKD